MIPGEDIEVYAKYEDGSKLATPVISNTDTDNSLFYSYDGNEADIKYIRHLENIDNDISNFDFTRLISTQSITTDELTAIQIDNITYNSDFYSSIYDKNSNDKGGYYGIYNKYLVEYNGAKHKIININSKGGNGGNSGIIGTVNLEDKNKTFKMKNLDIFDSSFGSEDLTGSAGSAIGSASSSVELQNVTIKSTDSNAISIKGNMGGVEGAGGLIGKTNGSLTVKNSHIDANDLSINGNNAGGIVGIVGGDCSITDSDVSGDNLSTIGNTSGGLVGETDGPLKITNAYVIGKNTAISGNFAGGIAGYTAAKIDISDTFSTAYVYAESTNAGGIAGGFIGSINNATSSSSIKRCYVSGHTEDGIYGTKVDSLATADKRVENFNIIANFIAGGFIGDVDGSSNVKVEHSYTTASAYSSMYVYKGSNLGIAGGFVGKIGDGSNLTVNKVYSAGLVSIAENGTDIGGFVGTGTITASGSNYYLKGKYTDPKDGTKHDFNNFNANGSGTGNISGVTGTSDEGILVSTDNKADAEPWDDTLKPENSADKAKYDYMSVAQLVPEGTTTPLTKHIGDWAKIEEDTSEHGIFIRNAEKLALVIKGKEFKGKKLSVRVYGVESKCDKYAQYDLNDSVIALHKTNFNNYNLNTNFKNDNGNYDYYIFLDDITQPQGSISNIFPTLKAGEDIKITAIVDQDKYFTEGELEELDENSGAFVGITNSLFADGSFNTNYTSAEYYSDINPSYAIVAPEGESNAYSDTALITNFRHLQNLDDTVSNIISCGFTPEKVKLCKDLYWAENTLYDSTIVNQVPEQTDENSESLNAFLKAINDDQNSTGAEVKIYKYNSNSATDALTISNAFYGIGKNHSYHMVEFDGQGHSINNLVINPTGTSINVGLFRDLFIDNHDKNFTIENFKLIYPKVVTASSGDTGAVIGKLDGHGNSTFDIKNIEIDYLTANGQTGNVGGMIGKVDTDAGLTCDVSKIKINNPEITATTGDVGGMIGIITGNVSSNYTFNLTGNVSDNEFNIELNYPTVSTSNGGDAGGMIGEINTKHDLTFNTQRIKIDTPTVTTTSKGDAGGMIGKIIGSYKHTFNFSSNASNNLSDNQYNIEIYYPRVVGVEGIVGGMIGEIETDHDLSFNASSIKMDHPDVSSTKGDLGGMIGKFTSNQDLSFNASNIYMNSPVINLSTGASDLGVGGMIGRIYTKRKKHTYTLNNITVDNTSITASTCDAAGGVIGILKTDYETTGNNASNLIFDASNITTTGTKVTVFSGDAAAVFGELYVYTKSKTVNNVERIEQEITNTNYTINNITSTGSIIKGNEHAAVLISRFGGGTTTGSACTSTVNVSNSLMTDSIVSTSNRSSTAGTLFGGYYNNGNITVDKVYSYGKNSLVRALKDYGNAGGLFGKAWYGSYRITNSGASNYVYAGRVAGGFIGDFKPTTTGTTSIINNCFVGGHVSKKTYNYIDGTALDVDPAKDSTITEQSEGGYNVWSQYNTGGFIGYYYAGDGGTNGTSTPVTVNISNCFTTASVKAEGIQTSGISNYYPGTIAGGFVGYLRYSDGSTFDSCYVAGRVFNDANKVGGFIGYNLIENRTKPQYKDVSILSGVNFNEYNEESFNSINIDGNVPQGKKYTTEYLKSLFVDEYSPRIISDNPSSVNVTTFNLPTGSNYPFKDTAVGINNVYVFYGDWVRPKTSYVSMENGNRLTASIDLIKDVTFKDMGGYYETYIKLIGQTSGANTIYRLRYNDNNYKNITQFDEWENEKNIERYTSMFDYYPSESSPSLDFYIDNPSSNNSNYLMTMSEGPLNALPGEEVLVNVSTTFEDVKTISNNTKAEGNSLFEKLERKDGKCIAKIANSRNLLNLDYAVSGLQNSWNTVVYEITNVEQTDNIYWIDDGSYITGNYKAKTEPYITELSSITDGSNVYIYQSNKDYKYTGSRKFRPIYVNESYALTEYDGGDFEIINLNLDDNETTGYASGLFGKTVNDFSVKKLTLTNTISIKEGNHVIEEDESKRTGSSGAVVGTAEKNLTLSNVYLKGTTQIQSMINAGGMVGSVSGNLTMENCGIGNHTNTVTESLIVKSTYNQGNLRTGGFVGTVGDKLTASNSYINCNTVNIESNLNNRSGVAGGFAGYLLNGTDMNGIHIDVNDMDVKSGNNCGGLIGHVAYRTEIKNTYLNGANFNVRGQKNTGGIIGEQEGRLPPKENNAIILNGVGISSLNGIVKNEINSDTTSSFDVGGAIGKIGHVFGGIVDIHNCYSSIYVDGKHSTCTGGFIGTIISTEGSITNSYSSGHTSGGTFINSYDEAVQGRYNVVSSGKYLGGFVGLINGPMTVKNCYSTNTVSSMRTADTNYYVGGFVGESLNKTTIEDCYTVGLVDTNSICKGSFAGLIEGQSPIISCYCLDRYNGTVNAVYYNKDSAPVDVTLLTKGIDDDPIIGSTDGGDMSYLTTPYDTSLTGIPYPYKNWTDANAYVGGSPSIVYYGDWVQ